VAISADSPDESKRHRQKLGFTFPVLSDQKLEVIRQYDLLHSGGGPHKADISRPAEFLVDSTGTVRWLNLTDSISVRARPEKALAAFDTLNISHD
jgi:peroxiredoxin